MPSADSSPPSTRCVHIEAVQTVIPEEISPVSLSKKISIDPSLTSSAFSSHLRIILYFSKSDEVDSRAVAARIKESLGAALSEDRLFAGRLRHEEAGLELKLNDAGVRLLQGKADFSMSEVLSSLERERVEGYLAKWVDVDEEKPHFSALFYMQVTGFLDGGISLGISCSLLLADPLALSKFLHKWAKVHSQMHSKNKFYTANYFNVENFKTKKGQGYLSSTPIDGHDGGSGATKSVMLEGGGGGSTPAVEEAARRLEVSPKEAAAGVVMIISESDRMKELKFVECNKREEVKEESWRSVGDWLGVSELYLAGGDGPMDSSWQIVAAATTRPLVVVMPALGGDHGGSPGMVSVTFPKVE